MKFHSFPLCLGGDKKSHIEPLTIVIYAAGRPNTFSDGFLRQQHTALDAAVRTHCINTMINAREVGCV